MNIERETLKLKRNIPLQYFVNDIMKFSISSSVAKSHNREPSAPFIALIPLEAGLPSKPPPIIISSILSLFRSANLAEENVVEVSIKVDHFRS